MKKYLFHLLISFRNVIIFSVCIFAVFFISDRIIGALSVKGDTAFNSVGSDSEDLIIRNMNVAKTPPENRACSKMFINYLKEAGLNNYITETSAAYPLINTGDPIDKEAFNIVVLGDSFVWGDGCTNVNELFWRQLELLMRNKGINCRVHAVGIGAANAYEELEWLTGTELVKDLDPDMVVFGYVYNDADPRTDFVGSDEIDWDHALPFLAPVKKIFPNIYSGLTERIGAKTLYSEKYGKQYTGNNITVLSGERYEYYKENFVVPLEIYAEKADFPIVVMTLPPMPDRVMTPELYAPLHELYEQVENVYFYDSLDALNDFASYKHKNNYRMSEVNAHPGSAVNYFYADFISDFIQTDFSSLLNHYLPDAAAEDKIYVNDSMPEMKVMQQSYVTEKDICLEFVYSTEKDIAYPNYLTAPLGKHYVKLCFDRPADISEIAAETDENIELYYTAINKKLGYDDHTVYGTVRNEDSFLLSRSANSENVTAILVAVDGEFPKNFSVKLTIKLT